MTKMLTDQENSQGINIIEIVVETESDKEFLLGALKDLYYENIDTELYPVNGLIHLYTVPVRFSVVKKTTEEQS